MAHVDDLVFLLPGFLGFDHFGGFPYFSQGVAAALHVALEVEWEKAGYENAFQILPLTTIPAGGLAERQERLSKQLVGVLGKCGDDGRPRRIHLVCHSTGGVDAELFASARSLRNDGVWTEAEARARRLVRSVVQIAAPAAGSGLALSPLGRLLATDRSMSIFHPLQWWPKLVEKLEGAGELFEVIRAIFALGPTNVAIGQFVAGGLDDLHPLLKFLESLLGDRALVDDLRPGTIAKIAADTGPVQTGGVPPRVRRYVTVASDAPDGSPSGRLFAAFHKICAEGLKGDEHAKKVGAALQERIKTRRIPLINATPVPSLSEQASDGVVNTGLQIPPGDDSASIERGLDQVAAVVVADHLDVVGGFPTDGALTRGADANGFLNSGSIFRSPQFSQLYRSIARDVAEAAR
jgi:hypothetical protein